MARLLACGFNAHNQLSLAPSDKSVRALEDVPSLTEIAVGKDEDGTKVLWAGWASSVLLIDSTIHILGHVPSAKAPLQIQLPQNEVSVSSIRSVFGDLNSVHGLLTWTGQLYSFTTTGDSMCLLAFGDKTAPTLSHIAIQSTGRTAIIFLQAKGSRMIHVLEFQDFKGFQNWFMDPSASSNEGSAKTFKHHMLGGRAVTLLAGATCFILLTEEGEVFTWGDGRHTRCLGRATDVDNVADQPGQISALGGIHISKIDGRGWAFGAMSRDGDLYLWGRNKPGAVEALDPILSSADEEIRLLADERFENVKDFAIGNGHIVVANPGEIYVIGNNENGQAGLGKGGSKFLEDWSRLEVLKPETHVAVIAGDASTFLITHE